MTHSNHRNMRQLYPSNNSVCVFVSERERGLCVCTCVRAHVRASCVLSVALHTQIRVECGLTFSGVSDCGA